MKTASLEQSELLRLIVMIPEIFEPVLILDSDFENFDIGYKSFWLLVKHDVSWDNIKYYSDEHLDYLRNKYSVSLTEPEITNECGVKYFEKSSFLKPSFLNGKIAQDFCLSPIVKNILQRN